MTIASAMTSAIARRAGRFDPRLPKRCSSPRRSRPMFARCVQKTNTATTTLITNSGDRTPTRDASSSTGSSVALVSDAERDVAARRAATTAKTSEREQRLDRREREEDAGRGRDALPSLAELEEDRPHVADDRGDAAQDRRRSTRIAHRHRRCGSSAGRTAPAARPSPCRTRRRARPIFAAEHANDVRRAEVARAVLAQVDAARLARRCTRPESSRAEYERDAARRASRAASAGSSGASGCAADCP